MGEPGVLPLRIVARRLLACGNRFVADHLAAKIGCDLAHPDRAHHRQLRVEPAREQGFDFLDRPAVEHMREPLVAAGVEPLARREEDQRAKLDSVRNPALAILLPVGERAARR